MAKVSIIIPVYNVEQYLRKCLDSLVNQTLSDIEIICVDNGSKDNSVAILREYEQKDERIKVFERTGIGPSSARNCGIDNASGDYITFVDSDDWVSPEMCEKTYQKAEETGADVVLFSYYRAANGNINQDERLIYCNEKMGNGVFDFDSDIETIIKKAPVETVGKLYKASVIKNINLRFPESVSFGEDICFFYTFCLQNPKMTILPKAFYYYRINVANSLVKKTDTIKGLYRVVLLIKKKYKSAPLKNKKEFFNKFIRRITTTFIYYWHNVYTIANRQKNYKYMIFLYYLYKTLPHRDDKVYKDLKKCVYHYPLNFLTRKFMEPFFELEIRRRRVALYLFGHQLLNFSTLSVNRFFYRIFYSLILWKLRLVGKFRKIRVGFFVIETAKWTYQNFYDALKADKNFEPFILLGNFKTQQGKTALDEHYSQIKSYFEQKGVKIYEVYDKDADEEKQYKKLNKSKADIIFYQQPWQIDYNQRPQKTHKNSLLCYIPYCFYSMDSYLNYLWDFQGIMWKYFVETDLHKKEYEKKYGAKNCVVTGSAKLDGYHFINGEDAEKCWKSKDKKRIIYAPHHSFDDGLHEVATFRENGKFILELAKRHPDTEWIFRPHPAFMDRVVKKSVMSLKEIEDYYKEWEKIAIISEGGNYYEMFASSDVLITDCISFLSEYAPTGKPVFHLRKKYQREAFNELVQKIDEGYYQIYSNDELAKVFEQVVCNGDDYLSGKRENNKKLLPTDVLASERIYEYLKKQLWI